MLSIKKAIYVEVRGLYVLSVKTTIYVCNRFNTSFCARDHKTNQVLKQINPTN